MFDTIVLLLDRFCTPPPPHTHRRRTEVEARRERLTGQASSLSPVHRRTVCLEEMTRAAEEEMICLAPCKILPGIETTALSSFFSLLQNALTHIHTPPPFLSSLHLLSSPSIARLSRQECSQSITGRSYGEPLGRVCVCVCLWLSD